MDTIEISIELEAEDIDADKFFRMVGIAAHNLLQGKRAYDEGNFDQDAKEMIDRIIQKESWWLKIEEDKNFTLSHE